MHSFTNPHRGTGLSDPRITAVLPSTNAGAVAHLLKFCPAHRPTPLLEARNIAAHTGVQHMAIKDERARMGLGSFKALGAAYVIAADAAAKGPQDWATALNGVTYVTASAGNHGMSVAAGARLFGARAVIYLAQTVPAAFEARLTGMGAQVIRAGARYEASMEAAMQGASENGWHLLSDSSWPGYTDRPRRVMEGYLQLAAETCDQINHPPTDIILQAGVGGIASAMAAYTRTIWGDAPRIVVVEPDAAPALWHSVRAGKIVETDGPVSQMGRLDCKTPSMIALAGLARDADLFVTITENEAAQGVEALARLGYTTTASGGAGLAALIAGLPGCGSQTRVLAILSEGRADG